MMNTRKELRDFLKILMKGTVDKDTAWQEIQITDEFKQWQNIAKRDGGNEQDVYAAYGELKAKAM